MPTEETKECKKCKHGFKVSALKNGLCDVCAKLPAQTDENEGRIVSSPTIRNTDVVTIVRETVKELIPTREQIEAMIKKIVNEKFAYLEQTETQTADSGETLTVANEEKAHKVKVFKPKKCIKCGKEFTPRVGFQKICDDCRKETK